MGLDRAKMVEQDLVDATTYLGVAGRLDGRSPLVDMTSSCSGIAGTWISTKTAADMVKEQAKQTARHKAPA